MMISFVNEKKRTLTDFEKKKEKGGEKRHTRTHTHKKKKNETLRAFVVVVKVVGYFLNARRSVWSVSTCSSAASLRGRGDRSKKKRKKKKKKKKR